MKARICPKCEHHNLSYARYCAECGGALSNHDARENRPSKKAALVSNNLSEPLLQYHDEEVVEGAGFWIRALAKAIDMAIHFVVYNLAFVLVLFVIGLLSGAIATPIEVIIQKLGRRSFTTSSLLILGSLIYTSFSEGLHGSSLGKLICGLVVLKENEEPCTFGPAVIRYLAFYIDTLFLGAVAAISMTSSPLKQRLGDKWAKTIVVKRKKARPESLRSNWRFTLVFIGAVSFDFALSIIAYLLKAYG